MPKTILLLIMPQKDFHPGGALAVKGAYEDSARTAEMIKNNYHNIDEIIVLMDSHHLNHIAHAVFWKNKHNENPQEFSVVTHAQVVSGEWFPRDPSMLTHAKYYTKRLAELGNFDLIIWPEHCLIGSEGHTIVPQLDKELQNWAGATMKNVDYILKGKSCLTEMYSAIEAEVQIPSDPSTQTDWHLLDRLKTADQLLICGQAKSHCVNYTVKSIMQYWNVDRDTPTEKYGSCPDKCPANCTMCKNCARNITLLADATSCVDNDDALTAVFKAVGDHLDDMIVKKGGKVCKCSEVEFARTGDLKVMEEI